MPRAVKKLIRTENSGISVISEFPQTGGLVLFQRDDAVGPIHIGNRRPAEFTGTSATQLSAFPTCRRPAY
jgi:hypothetical protein